MRIVLLAILWIGISGAFVLAQKDVSISVGFNENAWFGEKEIQREDNVLSVGIRPKRGRFDTKATNVEEKGNKNDWFWGNPPPGYNQESRIKFVSSDENILDIVKFSAFVSPLELRTTACTFS